MSDPKVLALVMAGGAGSRLEVLTAHRAKPAMPYAGVYRLIDFPLSNCMHSRIADVWVIQQYQPHSLNDHVSNGRPWDLDRTYGGLRILQPHQGAEGGWHRGNADAIFRHKSFIEEANPDVLVVLSSDHVYRLDYRDAIHTHHERGAQVTIVTTEVRRAEASRFGVVEVGDRERVTSFDYKPDEPRTNIATTEVFVFHPPTLLELLEQLNEEDESEGDGDNDGRRLEDLGDALLPRLVDSGGAYEHRLDGYWRDLGLVESYWASHMDLLGESPKIALDDPAWPIHTLAVQRPPARLEGSARIADSLVSPGAWIAGQVERSVLGPGVRVEAGATVRDSVILHDAMIASGARIDCAVVDMEACIGGGAGVGVALPGDPSEVEDSDIAVVGRGARVRADERVEAGARIGPAAGPRGSR